jgi:AraC family ethanolamine operon transcriptional activator
VFLAVYSVSAKTQIAHGLPMESHIFKDFDAFAASVRGVEATMMLQNPIRRAWAVDEVALPEISVQFGRLGSGNIVEGQGSRDGYLIYLPLTGECEYSANGVVLGKRSFAIFEPACDFCFSTEFAHDWCTIFVPSSMFARRDDLETPPSRANGFACRATREDCNLAHQFRSLVGQTMTAAANCDQFERTRAARFVEEELLNVASVVVGQSLAGEPHREGRPPRPREVIIRRCKEFLDQHDDEHVLVGQMADAADVSERTLRRAFTEYYGISPVRYLHLRQFHQVHRALRDADHEATTVTKILVQHGVWSFGRFASQYRQLFGKLPMQTLKTRTR